ncbi:MAG: copper amine oxidase N-terminal domain-containing protein [Defluviitaleaceae bacterium]|nr:copper amine oxidase N-terminal domain-containing protein [Defluviitaleaceae bacterium]
MKKSKERMKGFVLGFVLATIISSAAVVVANPGTMREVLYGVNIVVNGRAVNFAPDMRPFISNDRTYLPVRGVAYALDLPVDWDDDTNTVYIGRKPIDTTQLLGKWRMVSVEMTHPGLNERHVEYFEDAYFEFLTGGNLVLIEDGATENATWRAEGADLRMIFGDSPWDNVVMTAEINGDTLVLIMDSWGEITTTTLART